MSDILSARRLAPAHSQLPPSWYSDEALFALEKQLLFDAGPRYAGHELMVPQVGDYRTLAWLDHAQMLVRKESGVELMSNICRHRQAIMMQGFGNTKNVVCPLHRWTYNLDGELIGAPHFAQKPCLHLSRQTLTPWQGLLFAGERDVAADLAGMKLAADLDFSGYQLHRVELHECHYNWKTFIEVYLEDYHVAPFHPGLGRFVTCDDLTWQFGEQYSVQRVGINNALH
jgi:phenylpropionate dioxygenase-like ring-hydroxylating dioxygenase large terminal subunit